MSVDETFGGGRSLYGSGLNIRQRRLIAEKMRATMVIGDTKGIGLGENLRTLGEAKRLGLVQDPTFGAPVADYFKAHFPQEVVRTGPLPTVEDMGRGAADPSQIPYRGRVKLSKSARKAMHKRRLAEINDPDRIARQNGGGKWTDDRPSASPSAFQGEDYVDEPFRPGRSRFEGPKTTPAQNAARSQTEARKQSAKAGQRVSDAAQNAPKTRPVPRGGTGRSLINEMTRATRRGVDELASFELSDVRDLLRSTLSGVKGGRAYLKSHSFIEMLNDAEGFFTSSEMFDPKKALKSDIRVFKTMMGTLDAGITGPDRRFAYGMLDMVDDHEMLVDIARRMDPMGFKGVRYQGPTGKAAVKQFLRGKLDGASRLDVMTEEVENFAANVSNVRVNKKGRESFARMVDQIMNGDESWHNKGIERARRGEFNLNVGGISQTVHIGSSVNRRFDISAPYEYRQVFNGMEIIGSDGHVQSGVINGLGFTKESLRELEKAAGEQASDVVGFEMHLMQQNKLEFTELARGRDAMGRLKMGSVGNLVFQASAQQRQKFEHTSQHAFARQFQLDIETSYGRRRWSNEVMKMRGLDVGSADETFDGIVSLREKSLHRQLAAAVRSGNVDDIIAQSELMRTDDDVNRITQFAGVEKGRVKGSKLGSFASIKETGIEFSVGEKNTGIHAGRALSDEDFDGVINTLIEERIRQHRTGGAITGLNVDKFDMRVIREQAWRTGEEALARADKARSSLAPGVKDTAEIMAHQARADRMLAYSGRWTGSSWLGYESAGAMRLTRTMNKRIGSMAFSGAVPIADALQVSDITGNLIRPLASFAVKGKAADRVRIASPHIKEHFFGTNESGWIDVGEGKVRSQSLLSWGDRDQAVSTRMTSMLRSVDETELREAIRDASKSGSQLDEGMTGLLTDIHAAGKSGDMRQVRKLQTQMMRDFDKPEMHDVLDTLKKNWGHSKINDITERVSGAPASQESLMYSVDDVWDRLKAGLRDTDGITFLSKTAHNARRDLKMIDIAQELSFATLRNGGKFIGGMISKPTQQLIDFATKTAVSLPFVGNRGDGEPLVGKVAALLPKFDGEQVLEGEMAEYASSQIAAMRNKARGTIGVADKYITSAAASQARQIKSIIGGEVEMAKIARGLRYGYAGLAVTGIAAGAIVAGTVHKRAHQDDESWKYGPTEDPKARKLVQQRMSEAGIGQMVTDMSTRKNYSYNMRPDKHKHLFRGQ